MKTVRSSGFTLIELMITVAIVAILAAIAIPTYQNYIAKAQLSEAIELSAGLKAPLGEAYAQSNGAVVCILPPNAVTSGKYVASVVTANGGVDHCEVVATMKSNIAAKASGQTVTATYTPSAGTWACTSSADPSIVPNSCR